MSTKKFVIRPYKLASKGARLLAQEMSKLLGYKVLRVSTGYVPRRNESVINWGNNQEYWKDDTADSNTNPKTATNKLLAFKAFKEAGVPHPEWTTSQAEAEAWVNNGITILVRETLTGNSGQGIYVVEGNDPIGHVPLAPLYVKYKKKKKEFRAHVVNGKVIEVVEKRKRKGYEGVDTKIRNHTNGWVFCRDNVVVPMDLHSTAVDAVNSLGLTFGAVDLIYNEKENKTYALEVNSAPGIENSTVTSYAKAFTEGAL